MATSQSSTLASRVRGETLIVPNLSGLFRRWPSAVNPHYPAAEAIIDAKIREWIHEEHLRRRLRKVNLAMFCSSWYPKASLDRLLTLAYYTMWLFLWDDGIEEMAKESSGDTGLNDVKELHHRASEYVAFHLGLIESRDEPAAPTRYFGLFKHAATTLRIAMTPRKREAFLDQLKIYMRCCEVEQGYLRAGKLPTVHDYWQHRLGTSSIYTYCCLIEYMAAQAAPPKILLAPAMGIVWTEFNRNIIIINDVLSLKKEVRAASLHSLVPIAMNEKGLRLSDATADALALLRVSADNFDLAARRLENMVVGSSEDHAAVKTYLDVVRTNMTGNYLWSLTSDRYGVTSHIREDGSLELIL
ncbi:terpenoid synthase [Thozetella sp. PMI_491]|nr:terpenoid synthase [Thozetella sp. PMI_491]